MDKNITIIINPASGKKDSILWSINNAFHKKNIPWKIEVTQKKGDAYTLTKEAVKNKAPFVAVYGGDGTVAEVAKALINTQTPLAIIPGGTANIFAKELSIPIDPEQALVLLTRKKQTIKTVDVGLFQKAPFVLRIEAGLAAHMVKDTSRTTKRIFGQFSYLVHAFRHLHQEKKYTFAMHVDRKEITQTGVGLMIANVGNIGIEGYSVVPQSKIDDGLLDIIIFKEKSLGSLFSWVTHTIARKEHTRILKHWKAKKISVSFTHEQTIICDDVPMKTKTISAEILPQALRVLVP